MAQWGATDANTSSPIWTPAKFNQAPTAANRDALFGNTTSGGVIAGETIGVYGVDPTEMAKAGGIAGVTILNPGAGYTARPTVTFTSNTGSGATATAVATVVSVAANGIGSGYANGDTVQLASGTATTNAVFTVTTFAANGSVASLAITTPGAYTALPGLSAATTANVTGAGTGLTVATSWGVGAVTVTAEGQGYHDATAVFAGGGNNTVASVQTSGSKASGVAHAGWVVQTIGTGGRAGRVQTEVLVAMSSITGDASDDTTFPE